MISMDQIKEMMNDPDWHVRVAAMEVCRGLDVPVELIEKGMQDSDERVRAIATAIYQSRWG